MSVFRVPYAAKVPWGATLIMLGMCLFGLLVIDEPIGIGGAPLSMAATRGVLIGITALFALATLAGVRLAKLTADHELVVTDTDITLRPNGWSARVVTIPFASIRDVTVQSVMDNHFIRIRHEGGKATVNGTFLDHEQFSAILHRLETAAG